MVELAYRDATCGLELPHRPGKLEVAERRDLARFSLRAGDMVIATMSASLGVSFDQPPNRAATGEHYSALRLGPDEWLLLIDTRRADDIIGQIGKAAAGSAYALVDISHGQAGFDLTGPAVVDALAAGCPQDLRTASFPVGKCSRSIFAKAEVVLWRSAEDAFHLETWRSFAPYVMRYLACETVLV